MVIRGCESPHQCKHRFQMSARLIRRFSSFHILDIHPLPWVGSETRRGNGRRLLQTQEKIRVQGPSQEPGPHLGWLFWSASWSASSTATKNNNRNSHLSDDEVENPTSDPKSTLYASPSAATPRGLPSPHAGNINPRSWLGRRPGLPEYPIRRTWHRLHIPWRVGDLGLTSFHLAETMETIGPGSALAWSDSFVDLQE